MDSGASLSMMSESDLTPVEKKTIRKSTVASVVMTANGTTHTTEEATATVYVYGLDIFVGVKLLTESRAVLSLGKLCELLFV